MIKGICIKTYPGRQKKNGFGMVWIGFEWDLEVGMLMDYVSKCLVYLGCLFQGHFDVLLVWLLSLDEPERNQHPKRFAESKQKK